MPSDEQALAAIVEHGAKVLEWTADVDDDMWLADELYEDAVRMCLIWIGSAAADVSSAVTSRHPEVDWEGAVRYGDRLIGQYYDVTPQEVLRRSQDDLPAFHAQALEVLRAEFPDVAARYEEQGG